MKVTLEVIYQVEVVKERTEEIIAVVNDIKKRQEDDFRCLIQKIDTDIGQLRNEVKTEINQTMSPQVSVCAQPHFR